MASDPRQDSHVRLGLGLPHFLSICSVPSSMPGFTAGQPQGLQGQTAAAKLAAQA